jgi:hypothetical protein
MREILFPKPFLSGLIFILLVLAYVMPVKAQTSEWKASEKKDEIETFYQVEKVGTDSFEVTIKIKNNRYKEVIVETAVLYKTETAFGGGVLAPRSPNRASYIRCKESVPSNSTRTCEPIPVTAKKISGVRIICWYNTGGKCAAKRDLPPGRF